VLLVSAAVYVPALSGTFVWDDFSIMSGRAIGGGKSLAACFSRVFLDNYYRPLVSASFVLEKPFSRSIPFFYHQTNLMLHVLTTWVMIGLLYRAFKRRDVAILGALLLAVQPAQVSAVAWIGGRTDSLCALFMVLFAWRLICSAQGEGTTQRRNLLGALLFYACALFTKEQVLPAILLVPLAFRCWGSEPAPVLGRGRRRGVRAAIWEPILPFCAVGMLYVLLYAVICPLPARGATDGPLGILILSFRTICYYTLLLFAPNARWMHSMSLGTLVRAGIWPILAGAALYGAGIALFLRWLKRAPAAVWFLGFVALNLALVSNLWPVPSMLICPYRAGVAGIGGAALLAWGIITIVDSLRQADRFRFAAAPAWAAAASIVVWCGGLCWWGAGRYSNDEAISSTVVRYDPDSMWARYNYAAALRDRGRDLAAVHQMEALLVRLFECDAWKQPESAMKAIEQNPAMLLRIHEIQGSRINPNEWLAALYARLGFGRLDHHDPHGALLAFQTGERLDPISAEIAGGMGECAYDTKDFPKAIKRLRFAVNADSDLTRARRKLGQAYGAIGNWREACVVFKKVIHDIPWAGGSYKDLANAQIHTGDVKGAIETLQTALRRAPVRSDLKQMLADLQKNHGIRSGSNQAATNMSRLVDSAR